MTLKKLVLRQNYQQKNIGKHMLTLAATDVVGRQRGNRSQKDEMKISVKKMLIKHAAELSR